MAQHTRHARGRHARVAISDRRGTRRGSEGAPYPPQPATLLKALVGVGVGAAATPAATRSWAGRFARMEKIGCKMHGSFCRHIPARNLDEHSRNSTCAQCFPHFPRKCHNFLSSPPEFPNSPSISHYFKLLCIQLHQFLLKTHIYDENTSLDFTPKQGHRPKMQYKW